MRARPPGETRLGAGGRRVPPWAQHVDREVGCRACAGSPSSAPGWSGWRRPGTCRSTGWTSPCSTARGSLRAPPGATRGG
ncbi:hypothetical protein [Ornithinimicrobium kibberense]|uniref:hypothetical protein n=1 Tax=Ornithinimicrobium kibberense TaxID=282060 RepID=UPI0036137AC3